MGLLIFKNHLEVQHYLKNRFLVMYFYGVGINNVSAIARDINLIYYYCKRYNQTLYSRRIDYEYWLRKERKKLFPNCSYTVKRRKNTRASASLWSYNYGINNIDLNLVSRKLR